MEPSVGQALERRDRADTEALESAIRQYRAAHGRFPENLEALPEVRESDLDTSRWVYDSATGKVRLASQDPLPQPAKGADKKSSDSYVESVRRALEARDMADWKAMQVAINLYRSEEGRFPESLDALPIVRERNIDISRWLYDPVTGKVRLRG